jgi:precorrin-6B methylase 2
MIRRYAFRLALSSVFVSLLASAALAQQTTKPFEPTVGQAGKDVVWVPTPQALVDKMLDMAKVTPQDFLMDLGSGDGRTVISAAKRGLRAQGVEYNPDMVELSKRNATTAGVSDKATFIRGDIFETDFSKAQVITLFLLPTLNERLRPTILKMRPGTRIVSNSFTMGDWEADQSETITNCQSWCTAHLWIVPANVEGTWQMPQGALTLDQNYQMLSGTLGSGVISEGKVNGYDVTFKVGSTTYTGRLDGNTIKGSGWTATKK